MEEDGGGGADDAVQQWPLQLVPTVADKKEEEVGDATTDAADPQPSDETAVDPGKDTGDDFFDVVVTSVEHSSDAAAGASVTHAIASSLSSAGAYAAYTVELVVTKGASSYCIQRPLSTLFELLRALDVNAQQQTGNPAAEGTVDASTQVSVGIIPEFPAKNNATDAMIAQWCGSMTAFLAGRCSFLKAQAQWMAFVEETSVGHGSRTHMTAIEFILQPFPYEKIYIPRGSSHEVVVAASKEGRFIVWKFELEDFDVDFSVRFTPSPYKQPVELVHSRTRYLATSAGRPVEGMYRCVQAGKATLVWDNSYSRIRGKNILYQVQVVDNSIMESANAAADALDEAVQAKKRREHEEEHVTTSTVLAVSSQTEADSGGAAALSLYKNFFPETLMQQGWLLSAPINVAGKVASRLFGSQVNQSSGQLGGRNANSEARSLLEELNGLNMRLMERMESLEDKISQLTVERDQARSRTHMATVEKENTVTELNSKELEVTSLRAELQRMQREREAWRKIQAERDALLEEKHRWALTDFIGDDADVADPPGDLDSETRSRLEHELGQAEATVLRCRAELGYPLSNHLTGTSSRLEKIAQEMTATKRSYDEQMKQWEQETMEQKQQLIKLRGQKRVLVTEIRNMKTQTEGQVAVAMAEASEARMVNRRLKKQNELLLTQIRTLINDAEENERKFRELQDRVRDYENERCVADTGEMNDSMLSTSVPSLQPEVSSELARQASASDNEKPDESVPYTLSDADIALLNGKRRAHDVDGDTLESPSAHAPSSPTRNKDGRQRRLEASNNSYRPRLVAFFQERDPDMLSQVNEMLESYRGVEDSLFESLELKYSFMEINQRIAQAL